jgi:hypothetical protein
MALVALAARGRRLLRSAYRLIDAGERDTTMPLLCVLNEYFIVSRWLLEAEGDDLKVWALDDLHLHRRLTVLRGVLADPDVHQDVKDTLTVEVASTEAAIKNYVGDEVPAAPAEVCLECERPLTKGGRQRPPSLKQMARKAGQSFAYSYSFRLLSQYDAHASVLAIDSTYDITDRLRREARAAVWARRVRGLPRGRPALSSSSRTATGARQQSARRGFAFTPRSRGRAFFPASMR